MTAPDIDSSSESKRAVRAFLGGLALMLALLGQVILLSMSTDQLDTGQLLISLGLSLAGIVLLVLGHTPRLLDRMLPLAKYLPPVPGVLVGVAVILSILAAVTDAIFEQMGQLNYWLVLVLWLSSAAMYLAACATGQGGALDWRAGLRAHRRELIAVGLVTLFAAGLRFYQLGSIPRVLDGDGGRIGLYALSTTQTGLANPFALIENVSGMYLQIIYLCVSLFDRTAFALRLITAVGGTLAIPALYLLARRLFGPRVALLAAFLLAVSHSHIHFSRIVAVLYIQGTFLIPLELYFFISGLENRSAWRMALGGLILGLHFSVYISAQIVAAMLVVYIVLIFWLCRSLLQKSIRLVLVFGLGVVLMALPEAAYAWRHPQEFMARLSLDGTFQSNWLAGRMAETGQSMPAILFDRLQHAFLSLIYYPALDFYGAPVPILSFVAGFLFVFGLGYALWRTRDYRYLLLNGYFWAATVAVSLFSVPPSADSYRMLIALPAAVIMAAVGLEKLLALFSLTEPARRVARLTVSALVLLAVLLLNVRIYFVDFAAQCRYGDPQTRYASYLGNYLRELHRETAVYLLSDDIFRYGTHDSAIFLSRNFPVNNFPEAASTLPLETDMVVIAVPARVDELRAWVREHPGGQLHVEYDCDKLILLAYQMP